MIMIYDTFKHKGYEDEAEILAMKFDLPLIS